MQRIDTSTAEPDKHGPDKPGFRNGDPLAGTPATALNAAFFDSIQEEVCRAVEKSGIELDGEVFDQLTQAIRRITSTQAATLSADTTLDLSHAGLVLVDASGGPVTLTLPPASTLPGLRYTFARTDSSVNAVTLLPDSSEPDTLDGAPLLYLDFDSLAIRADGQKRWYRSVPRTREPMPAARTYYVDGSNGDDMNDGRTSGTAFQTIQRAIDFLAGQIDTRGYDVTIQIAAGTYEENVKMKSLLWGTSEFKLQGDDQNPSNVLIKPAAGHAIEASATIGTMALGGLKIESPGGYGIRSADGSSINLSGPIEFGVCQNEQLYATGNGSITTTTNYEISGSALRHIFASRGGTVTLGGNTTVELTSTPAFGAGFVQVEGPSMVTIPGVTFSGTATGQRYRAQRNGVIHVSGAGENYLPGDASGFVDSGGQYG